MGNPSLCTGYALLRPSHFAALELPNNDLPIKQADSDSAIIERTADLFDTSTGRMTHFFKSVEEFLEMLGTTLFLYVFLSQLAVLTRSITFELTEPED